MYALKGSDKEDESDVTFTAFCPPTLLTWSASPLESSGSAARQENFFVLYLIVALVISVHYICTL